MPSRISSAIVFAISSPAATSSTTTPIVSAWISTVVRAFPLARVCCVALKLP
jgi:hypothetical protein